MKGEPRFQPLSYGERTDEEALDAVRGLQAEMATRRSVRHFSPDPVDRELIDAAIEVAGGAPSGANLQPWHFVVVGDPEIKREIRLAAEEEERENYSRRFPDEWKQLLAPLATDWRKEFLEVAPWLIVVFRVDWSLRPDGKRQKHYYIGESVGLAAGFLLTALHVAGLATLTHTPSPMGFLTRILGRGAGERPFLLIPVGHPAPDCEVPLLSKKGLEEIRTLLD